MGEWQPDRYGRLRRLLRGADLDAEIREELEHHVAERMAANVARGMPPDRAREDALRRFGDMDRFRREMQEIDESTEREERRIEVMQSLWRELRQALRGLARAPGFSLVAVVTLALGLGAATAVYTLLDHVVLQPLPYPAQERLVRLAHPVPGLQQAGEFGLSSASYFHFRQRSQTLEDLGLYAVASRNVRIGAEASPARVAAATASLFDLLGASAGVGRLILPSDDQPGVPRVAVLTHEYWQNVLGSDSGIVGRTIGIGSDAVEVVGVLDRDFEMIGDGVDLFVPLRLSAAGPHYNSHYLTGIGRMRPGATLASVQAELAALTAELPDAYPNVYGGGFIEATGFTVTVEDLGTWIVGNVADVLWIVLASVLLVLFIACANVGNLYLVRTEAKRGELTVRAALGASRGHLLLHSLAESLLITIAAAALGIWLALLGVRVVLALTPTTLPRVSDATLSWSSIAFAAGTALAVAVVLALLPVMRGGKWSTLRETSRGATTSRNGLRFRGALVAAQIALALVLLSAAGLMLRSFAALRSVDLGMQTDRVLTLAIALPSVRNASDDEARRAFDLTTDYWRELSEAVAGLPGVVAVGSTNRLPLLGRSCAVTTVQPAPAERGSLDCVPNASVTPGYFDALGIRLEGRAPEWEDVRRGTGAVVVSRTLAEQLWPGENAIGRHLRVPNMPPDEGAWYEIVGVTTEIRTTGADEPPTPMIFYPVRPIEGAPLWSPHYGMTLVVRTSTDDPMQLAGAIRRIARGLEPGVALSEARTMNTFVAQSMNRTSFTLAMLGIAGVMALVLSMVGLYGVVAYTVNRRRNEIGIRMALGAAASNVGGMILLDSLRMGAFGVLIGLIGAAFATRALQSLLFETTPTDGLTLSVAAALLLIVAAIASYVPARRAARVDPADSLRA